MYTAGCFFMIRTFNLRKFLSSLALTLGAGFFAAFLTNGTYEVYETLNKPPLSPPGWVFAVVWSILYIMMGIALYAVRESSGCRGLKADAYRVFAVQLILNIGWPIVFFVFRAYLLSVIWLCVLIGFVFATVRLFWTINKCGGRLLVPYLIWCLYALYLNVGIYILN